MYIEFKPGEKHASKGADTAETPDSFRDAGWLLEKDEVVIDIDSLSKDQIREYIKRAGIKTAIPQKPLLYWASGLVFIIP